MQEQHLTPKTNGNRPNGVHDAKQRRRMWLAIVLLLGAVIVIVVKDWHVWFPPADGTGTEAEVTEPARPASPPAVNTPPPVTPPEAKKPSVPKPAIHSKVETHKKAEQKPLIPAAEASAKPPVVAEKTAVAPPLALRVVTGDAFQKLYPGNEGLRVELQSGSRGFPKYSEKAVLSPAPLSPAAERAPISTDVTRVPVEPAAAPYPTLAQKMKVQGSVVLQAVIGSDGLIEDLRVLSGPALLASAAREAVRQWHFKPYLQNGQPVETLAKITVNFIISTS